MKKRLFLGIILSSLLIVFYFFSQEKIQNEGELEPKKITEQPKKLNADKTNKTPQSLSTVPFAPSDSSAIPERGEQGILNRLYLEVENSGASGIHEVLGSEISYENRIKFLRSQLKHESAQVRFAAVNYLYIHGDESGYDTLQELLAQTKIERYPPKGEFNHVDILSLYEHYRIEDKNGLLANKIYSIEDWQLLRGKLDFLLRMNIIRAEYFDSTSKFYGHLLDYSDQNPRSYYYLDFLRLYKSGFKFAKADGLKFAEDRFINGAKGMDEPSKKIEVKTINAYTLAALGHPEAESYTGYLKDVIQTPYINKNGYTVQSYANQALEYLADLKTSDTQSFMENQLLTAFTKDNHEIQQRLYVNLIMRYKSRKALENIESILDRPRSESTGSTYDLMRLVAQIPNKRIQEKLNNWTSEGSQRYLNDIRMHSPYYVLADRYMYDFHIDEWNAIKEFYEFL